MSCPLRKRLTAREENFNRPDHPRVSFGPEWPGLVKISNLKTLTIDQDGKMSLHRTSDTFWTVVVQWCRPAGVGIYRRNRDDIQKPLLKNRKNVIYLVWFYIIICRNYYFRAHKFRFFYVFSHGFLYIFPRFLIISRNNYHFSHYFHINLPHYSPFHNFIPSISS